METKPQDRTGRRAEPRRSELQDKDPEQKPGRAGGGTPADPEERRRRIAEAAYYRAERRGFAAGYEDADWLDAEQEVDAPRPEDRPGKREPGKTAAPAAKKRTEDAAS